MTVDGSLSQLRQLQTLLLEIVKNTSVNDYARQSHPDLSPLGWHLGHCVFMETYWLREVVMGVEKISDELKALYIPELSVKVARGGALPSHAELCEWAGIMQQTNCDYLGGLLETGSEAELMQDNYLLFFLSQHYAQHIETANYILTQHHLQRTSDFEVESPLTAAALRHDYCEMNGGRYAIGADDRLRHYDNECPGFSVELEAFQIANTVLSNAEFLGFMEAGGYQNANYWSAEAWLWRTENAISHPQHWRLDGSGNFYGTNADGPCLLQANDAVSGLSYYEAIALARWKEARLPHEYEWETAKKAGLLAESGQVWEWCQNAFHPYTGFAAFPYEGYSLPWFDQQHFTLRGGSQYTLPLINRDSFRNFYQADKRHFPAGVRLVVLH
jgi:ergothioneine biosynthesis protein EgtB